MATTLKAIKLGYVNANGLDYKLTSMNLFLFSIYANCLEIYT